MVVLTFLAGGAIGSLVTGAYLVGYHMGLRIQEKQLYLGKLRIMTRDFLGFTDKQKHIAFLGSVNSGKSTLANSIRGMDDNDQYAAPTGPFETTMKRGKYDFSNNIWIHDFPGSDTPDNPREGYFVNNEGEAFDYHYIITGTSLTETDMEIAKQVASINDVQFSLVRSQCDKDLGNMKQADGKLTHNMKTDFRQQANKVYLERLPAEVREKVDELFLVSGQELLRVVKGEEPGKYAMDEKKFWQHFQKIAKGE